MLSLFKGKNICFITIAFFICNGCSSTGIKDKVSFSKIGALFGIYSNTEDESTYELEIPFEKAINKAFDRELRGKKFRFRAIYKGTSPNPGPWKSVKDFININLCDTEKHDVCSDLIVIESTQGDTIFKLNDNQVVDVFGVLLETSGFETGGGTMSWSQVASKAPYNFISVFIIRPSNTDQSDNKPAISESKNAIIPQNQTTTQAKLLKENENALIMSKATILKAQQKLMNFGYDPGPVDGVLGKMTKKAIIEFQQNNGLEVTGTMNKVTLEKLKVE